MALTDSPPEIVAVPDAQAMAQEPFIPELAAAYLATAERQLEDALTGHLGFLVSADGRRALVGGLRQHFARLTNLIVAQRFTSYRLALDPLWRPAECPPGHAPLGTPRGNLDRYIAWEQLEAPFTEAGDFPELGRLLELARHNWLAATTELLDRLAKHQAELLAFPEFVGHDELPPLTDAVYGISDPHAGGRTAIILTLGETQLVYKPRVLQAEAAWGDFASLVIGEGLGLDIQVPTQLSGDGYGFMSFVAHDPCLDLDAVHRCYLRYGAVLAIGHAIGTCDLHHENIIVSGEHPVVIDAEALFRTRLLTNDDGAERLRFERDPGQDEIALRESVLELGILPGYMFSPVPFGDETIPAENEYGALCAHASTPIWDIVPCGLGSDEMQMRARPLQATVFPSLPELAGLPALPDQHIEAIVSGFEAAYEYLVNHRHELLALDGLLAQHASTPVRIIARPTMEYANALSRSLSPEPLRSNERRRELIDSDLEALSETRFDTIRSWADEESRQLLDGDIPRFEVPANMAGPGPAGSSAYDNARQRLEGLDDLDRRMQVATIRQQLGHRGLTDRFHAGDGEADAVPQRFAAQGTAIVEALVTAADERNGVPEWVFASFVPGLGMTTAHIDRESLYDGSAGTAVLIAEAGRVMGRNDWSELAVRAFAHVSAEVTPMAARRGPGMARGLGGLVFAMTRVGRAAGDSRLLDVAAELVIQHGEALGASADRDEVLFGRSGLLLATIALHRDRPRPELVRVADALAHQIIANAHQGERGLSWTDPDGVSIPHVSHGTSGVALALARWAQLKEDHTTVGLLTQALEFDDSFFDAERCGWVDGRAPGGPDTAPVTWSWCNGRSGGLLARSLIESAVGSSGSSSVFASAVHAPRGDILLDTSPGLCCGTAGAIDSLLSVADTTGTRDGPLAARIGDAVHQLSLKSPSTQVSTLTGSLFTGTAGLAYGLFRAASPNQVPGLLSFD